jgi:FkbM family methyltransferase
VAVAALVIIAGLASRALERVRRALRALLGGTPAYAVAAALVDGASIVAKDGIATWVALRRLRGGEPGSPPVSCRLRTLAHPILLRPGSEDAATVTNTVVRGEWGAFSAPAAPRWMIDAGAYIGDTTAYFLSRFPTLRALALEPNPASYALALENLRPYGERAVVLNAGLWGTEGSAHVAGEFTHAAIGPTGIEIRTVDVPALLRQFSIDHVDILKMDVEGAECSILSADPGAWLPKVSLLLLEIHGPTAMSVVRPILEAAGFRLRRHRSGWYCAR